MASHDHGKRNQKDELMSIFMISSVEFLNSIWVNWEAEAIRKGLMSLLHISDAYLLRAPEHFIDELIPEVSSVEPLKDIRVLVKHTVHEPIRSILDDFLNHPTFLLLETLILKALLFLLGHLHFLNLGALLCANTLKLDCRTLILHFRDREPEVESVIVLLQDVVESELNHNLSEGRVGLAPLYGLRIPYHIVHLRDLTLLVIIFADRAQTERDSDAHIGPQLLPVSLRDGLFFKCIDYLVLGHVNEDFLAVGVLGLDDEADLWLDDGAPLGVDDWLAVLVDVGLLVAIKVLRLLSIHQLFVHLHDLLVRVFLEKLLCLLGGGWGSIWSVGTRATHQVEQRVSILDAIIVKATSGCYARQVCQLTLELVHII